MHQTANMNDARISTMFDRPRLLNRKWWIMPEELHAALPDVSISRFPSILSVPRTLSEAKSLNDSVQSSLAAGIREREIEIFAQHYLCLLIVAADAVLRCSTAASRKAVNYLTTLYTWRIGARGRFIRRFACPSQRPVHQP